MIDTTCPELLHICPACELQLASETLLCHVCGDALKDYLRMVTDGEITEDVPVEAVRRDLAKRAKRFEARKRPVAPAHRAILSTPQGSSELLNWFWMLGAVLIAFSPLCVWEVAAKFLIKEVDANG